MSRRRHASTPAAGRVDKRLRSLEALAALRGRPRTGDVDSPAEEAAVPTTVEAGLPVRPTRGPGPEPGEVPDDSTLFRTAVAGVTPLRANDRVYLDAPKPPPAPVPVKRSEDEQAALREAMESPMTLEDRLDAGDEVAFLRPGVPRRVLADLRRGRWVLQGELDLHGLKRDEAREALTVFLSTCLQQGRRCVRVIHGKGLGSPGRESILKQLSQRWLAQREEILAFCQASPGQGGSGALLVLLRGRKAGRG